LPTKLIENKFPSGWVRIEHGEDLGVGGYGNFGDDDDDDDDDQNYDDRFLHQN
jgi:hypothetical protein